MLLVAHATVLGYRPGELFEVDEADEAEMRIVRPYLAGRYVSVVESEDPPAPEDAPRSSSGRPAPDPGLRRSLIPGDVELEGFNYAELRRFAGHHGIDLSGARSRVAVERRIRIALGAIDEPAS